MINFEIKINDRTIAWINYSKIVKLNGTTAKVQLPEKFVPSAYNDELIGFDYSCANLKSFGCEHSAQKIIEEWNKLEKEGLPLSKATEMLFRAELFSVIRGFAPIVSPWINLVELVDLIKSCSGVKGFKQRCNHEIKKRLKGIVENMDLMKNDPVSYLARVDELSKAVNSLVSEYTIIHNLIKIDKYKNKIKLPPDGYDIKLMGIKAGMIEVKSINEPVIYDLLKRHEKERKSEPSEPASVTLRSIVMMLCWTAAKPIERAFEDQEARIVFVDVLHSFSGFLMATVPSVFKKELPFNHAVDEAIKLAKFGKSAVVIYTRIFSSNHQILAWTFDREIVEKIGKDVMDKLRVELRKSTRTEVSSHDLNKIVGKLLKNYNIS